MLSVLIEAFKKSPLCSSVHFSQIVVWYTATALYITLHSSSARLDGIDPLHIQLIGIWDSTDHRSGRNKRGGEWYLEKRGSRKKFGRISKSRKRF